VYRKNRVSSSILDEYREAKAIAQNIVDKKKELLVQADVTRDVTQEAEVA